jgi:hypothetical protein
MSAWLDFFVGLSSFLFDSFDALLAMKYTPQNIYRFADLERP